jgi:hypothetical protein
LPTKILLIERFHDALGRAAFSARCHAGVLRLGQSLTTATSPDGSSRQIEVRCVEIRWTETVMLAELGENYGGLVVLEGVDASSLETEWTLTSE